MTAAIAAFFSAVAALFRPLAALLLARAIRSEAEARARATNAEAYAATRKEIDHADIVGDDPAAARRWLSERAARHPTPGD